MADQMTVASVDSSYDFDTRLSQLRSFLETNGRKPSAFSDDASEKRLARWMYDINQEGGVCRDRMHAVLGEYGLAIQRLRNAEDYLSSLKKFMLREERFPSYDGSVVVDGINERDLYAFALRLVRSGKNRDAVKRLEDLVITFDLYNTCRLFVGEEIGDFVPGMGVPSDDMLQIGTDDDSEMSTVGKAVESTPDVVERQIFDFKHTGSGRVSVSGLQGSPKPKSFSEEEFDDRFKVLDDFHCSFREVPRFLKRLGVSMDVSYDDHDLQVWKNANSRDVDFNVAFYTGKDPSRIDKFREAAGNSLIEVKVSGIDDRASLYAKKIESMLPEEYLCTWSDSFPRERYPGRPVGLNIGFFGKLFDREDSFSDFKDFWADFYEELTLRGIMVSSLRFEGNTVAEKALARYVLSEESVSDLMNMNKGWWYRDHLLFDCQEEHLRNMMVYISPDSKSRESVAKGMNKMVFNGIKFTGVGEGYKKMSETRSKKHLPGMPRL